MGSLFFALQFFVFGHTVPMQHNRHNNYAVGMEDSVLNKIMLAKPAWFHSWEWKLDDIKAYYFAQYANKQIPLQWETYAITSTANLEPMMIGNMQELEIDIYTYNTQIDFVRDTMWVHFHKPQAKAYLQHKNEDKHALLVACAATETVEDAFWMDGNTAVLLGYTSIQADYFTPSIWIYDIKKQNLGKWLYLSSFFGQRKNYFFKKFPLAKERPDIRH